MQKSVVLLYNNNELSEKENFLNPLYNSIKENKIHRNKFNQGGENLYAGKYKTLIKEIKEDTNKWKDI